VEHQIPETLLHGIKSIAAEQLPHGEIPNYRRLSNGGWEYCFSPLVSAYIYNALGCFDPSSGSFDLQALESAGPTHMYTLGRMAMEIRRRIYRFLCWQQCMDGTWRFFGQGSGLPADLDTSCCASSIFLDRRSFDLSCGFGRTLAALSAFPFHDGSFDSPESRGASFAGCRDLRRVANANMVRCFGLAGLDHGMLAEGILRDFLGTKSEGRARLAWLYALGRAYRQGLVAVLGEIAEPISREMLQSGTAANEFGGPLSTALAFSALLDFGTPETVRQMDTDRLAHNILAAHRSRLETFCEERCGSAALTTAISISALARAAH
jgi:hypothetical protein